MGRPGRLAIKAIPILLLGAWCSAGPETFFPGHTGLGVQHGKRNEPETWPLTSPWPLGSFLNMEFFGATSPSPTGSSALGVALDSAGLENSLGHSAPH